VKIAETLDMLGKEEPPSSVVDSLDKLHAIAANGLAEALDALDPDDHLLWVDQPPIDLNALAVADQVRRGEESGPTAVRRQHRLGHRGDRTLAFTAGDMDRRVRPLRMFEGPQQRPNHVEARSESEPPPLIEPVECGAVWIAPHGPVESERPFGLSVAGGGGAGSVGRAFAIGTVDVLERPDDLPQGRLRAQRVQYGRHRVLVRRFGDLAQSVERRRMPARVASGA